MPQGQDLILVGNYVETYGGGKVPVPFAYLGMALQVLWSVSFFCQLSASASFLTPNVKSNIYLVLKYIYFSTFKLIQVPMWLGLSFLCMFL